MINESMLLLSFHIGIERYSISAKNIIEILPLTQLKKIPKAPEYILGLLDYRGTPSPVIDLCKLIEARKCNKVLSSRIIMLNYTDSNKQSHILGITAEKVTETININRDEFHNNAVSPKGTPFLGEIANTEQGMVQLVEIEKLLPDDVQSILFQDSNLNLQENN
jgi:chemotaxis-related protein WspB